MINAKIKVVFIGIVCLLLVLAGSGCRKCYRCSELYGSFKCYKGNDSVKFAISGTQINDTLNKLYANGYHCDTMVFVYLYHKDACGTQEYNALTHTGDSCKPYPHYP